MRFTWLTREVPFGRAGGDYLYSAGLITALANQGWTGTVVSHQGSPGPAGAAPGGVQVRLAPGRPRSRAPSLVSPLPSHAHSLGTRDFRREVAAALAEPTDAIFIDYFAMGWTLPLIRRAVRRARQRPKVVYVAHNHEAKTRIEVSRTYDRVLMRPVLLYDALKGALLEKSLIANADLVTAITEADGHAFRAARASRSVLTLPPGYDGPIAELSPLTESHPRRVVICGSFNWVAKQQSLRTVVRKAAPRFRARNIELVVVGDVPEPLRNALAADYPECSFTGIVPDVGPYIRSARIGLLPDEHGGGFKLKMLDYIFNGVVVAGLASQLTGLPAEALRNSIGGASIDDVLDALIEHIDRTDKLDHMRRAAFDACRRGFSWADRGGSLVDALTSSTLRAGGTAAIPPGSGFEEDQARIHERMCKVDG